ncbi:uncharacterized protein LOC132751075 [Ruditapes philippinarum]|uniref:uncharacterized protein LOC132751075 n=1 Tax=Ruditapes philippinarum TaxID=129788 RepID=UPI00295B0A44|nr:uncharacterized protein LOC132751075 [Ruditapes philippinarum]
MIATLFTVLFCLFGTWKEVSCNPGRPVIPDNQDAARIFSIAEANRNTTADGYLSLEEMGDIFHNFDINDDQCIDETEFIAHWTNLKLGDLDAAIRLFHHADTDRDGCIEKDPDYSRLFYYFDRDGDGKISEMEFKRVWYGLSA